MTGITTRQLQEAVGSDKNFIYVIPRAGMRPYLDSLLLHLYPEARRKMRGVWELPNGKWMRIIPVGSKPEGETCKIVIDHAVWQTARLHEVMPWVETKERNDTSDGD